MNGRILIAAVALIAGMLGPTGDGATQSRAPEAYFLPEAGSQPILQLLREARGSIELAAYVITDFEMTEALRAAERRGVRVRIVLDEEQALRNKFSQYGMFGKVGVRDVRLTPRESGIMANDFGVIDQRVVYTGSSFLHTSIKDSPKFANYLILHDERLVERYVREFERLFDRSRSRF